MKPAEYERMDAEVLAEVDDAVRFADESPDPDPDQLFADVYRE
jgi:pyruvate dehydrogenase E1 component alpha subunit